MKPPAEKARLWRNLPHVQALKVDVHPGAFFTKELLTRNKTKVAAYVINTANK